MQYRVEGVLSYENWVKLHPQRHPPVVLLIIIIITITIIISSQTTYQVKYLLQSCPRPPDSLLCSSSVDCWTQSQNSAHITTLHNVHTYHTSTLYHINLHTYHTSTLYHITTLHNLHSIGIVLVGPSPRSRGSARPKTASSLILRGHV